MRAHMDAALIGEGIGEAHVAELAGVGIVGAAVWYVVIFRIALKPVLSSNMPGSPRDTYI